MSKILYELKFAFDYYIGYFFYNAKTHYRWTNQMLTKYPEKFSNEIKYLNQKKQQSTS